MKELENDFGFDAILGYLGIRVLDDANPYFGRFSYDHQQYVLYQSDGRTLCLSLRTLGRLSPIEFLLYNLQDRSVLNLERTLEHLRNLPDHIHCEVPEFRPIKESQLMANILGIESIIDYTVTEEEESNLYQFLQHLDNKNCAIFSGIHPNEYVMCIYQNEKLINAITFNLGTRQIFLTENGFIEPIANKKSDKRVFISDINHLVNDKLYSGEGELYLFRFFNSTLIINLDDIHKESLFIVTAEEYSMVLQILFNCLVKEGLFSSATAHHDFHRNLLSIHISGYGKKPFKIDQLSEPIKYLLKKALKVGSAMPKHPFNDFVFNQSYYFGGADLHQFTNSKANDFALTLPLKTEFMIPLFDHFAQLLPVKYKLKLIG
ncbi:MAG: hypothetical protein KI791_09225 [Cyclobacteriaceae bacterium]|nr:hypothetical protein [Cyclobacteriaceae bacterium SS2]